MKISEPVNKQNVYKDQYHQQQAQCLRRPGWLCTGPTWGYTECLTSRAKGFLFPCALELHDLSQMRFAFVYLLKGVRSESDYDLYCCFRFYKDEDISPWNYRRRPFWCLILIIQVDIVKNQRFVFQLVEQSAKTFEQPWFSVYFREGNHRNARHHRHWHRHGCRSRRWRTFDTNSKLGNRNLVFEKGGLVYRPYHPNAARPSGFGEDRDQQNDTFFGKIISSRTRKRARNGRVILCSFLADVVLSIPCAHDGYLRKKFGTEFCDQLVNTWYKETEALMGLSSHDKHLPSEFHGTAEYRDGVNGSGDASLPIFSQNKSFDFTLGAFSPIDSAWHSHEEVSECVEHLNWKILLQDRDSQYHAIWRRHLPEERRFGKASCRHEDRVGSWERRLSPAI